MKSSFLIGGAEGEGAAGFFFGVVGVELDLEFPFISSGDGLGLGFCFNVGRIAFTSSSSIVIFCPAALA